MMKNQVFSFFQNKLTLFSLVSLIAILGLSYVPLFHRLAEPSIFAWDEAFYAKNSIETTINNNFIVMTEDGAPSPFNTKPPLVIWAQSLCMRIFGINTFSLRLPSALSGIILVLAFFLFFKKRFYSPLMFIAASLTLLTASGYINWHVVRTGDLDALLAMFTVLYSLYYFDGLLSDKLKPHFFYIMALLITMAVYTKSIAGLMLIPGLIISTLFSDKRATIFKNIHLYIAAVLSIIAIALYYYLRELKAPGFISMVWNSEVVRFNNDITPWHRHPSLWFIDRFINETFYPIVFLIPVSIIAGLFSKNDKIRKLTLFTSITAFSYLFLISYPPDKLFWYDAPLYGLFAVLIAILFYVIEEYLMFVFKKRTWIPSLLSIVLCTLLFIKPYSNIYNKIEAQSKLCEPSELEAIFTKKIIEKGENYPFTIFYKPPMLINKFQIDFFAVGQKYNNDIEINQTDTISNINIYDRVLVCQDDKEKILLENYEISKIDSWDKCKMYIIKDSIKLAGE